MVKLFQEKETGFTNSLKEAKMWKVIWKPLKKKSDQDLLLKEIETALKRAREYGLISCNDDKYLLHFLKGWMQAGLRERK
jgi:hypothetical protein